MSPIVYSFCRSINMILLEAIAPFDNASAVGCQYRQTKYVCSHANIFLVAESWAAFEDDYGI